jgi:F-type H+-transporting ATPase subunit epsilon
MAELLLEIVTPAKSYFKGAIKSVIVPGTAGSFQVLVNHAPLISTLDVGVISIELPDGLRKHYTTGGGTIEVNNNNILILADSIELFEEIDVERARRAAERSRQRLAERDKSTDLERAEKALKRAMNRLKAVEKKIKSEV